MKFTHKSGRVIETKNAYEEGIIKANPNYTEYKEEKPQEIEAKPQKTNKKGGKEPL